MIDQPFANLRQFADVMSVAIFSKDDTDISVFSDEADANAATALGYQTYASGEQVHGAKTAVVHRPVHQLAGVDGLATDQSGLVIMTRWADCQNFVFFEPQKRVLSVLHAGWRGIVGNAIEKHIQCLQQEWSVEPAALLVGAGPSLCQQCAEFSDPSSELPNVPDRFFDGRLVNLPAVADWQLAGAGVPPDNIERLADCPRCQPGTYWSYRADAEGVLSGGRNILAAVLRE